jgi:hypothetical protein
LPPFWNLLKSLCVKQGYKFLFLSYWWVSVNGSVILWPISFTHNFKTILNVSITGSSWRRLSSEMQCCVVRWKSTSMKPLACYLLRVGFLLGLFFDPDDGSNTLLQNFRRFSTDYTALYPRRLNSWFVIIRKLLYQLQRLYNTTQDNEEGILDRIWKEAVVAYIKTYSGILLFCVRNSQNTEIWIAVTRIRFEPYTTRICFQHSSSIILFDCRFRTFV